MHHHYGIKGDSAADFLDVQWLANVEGDLRIEDLSEPIIYLLHSSREAARLRWRVSPGCQH